VPGPPSARDHRLTEGGVSFATPLAEMPCGRFASFLDTEGNEFGLRE
jgi:predicted enzyme related to lactoylglutathione lyase